MLRRSSRLLLQAVQNVVKTNSGCVTKPLCTDKFVVKHDDMNQMFYIQLDTGMEIKSQNLFPN
jgi:hypothetical protein